MKIDLHLHTPSSRLNGDSITWESTSDSIRKLYENNIRMASFTDHNTFDLYLYKEAKKIGLTGNIVFLPGIEIDVVKKDGIKAHMLIIFKENLNDKELESIRTISNNILKNGVSIKAINNLYHDFDTIRIIHIGKNDYFSVADLEDLNYDAFEITNIKHHNYLSVKKSKYESSIVSFSDTHHWNKYPQCKELKTEIDGMEEATFECLKKYLFLKKEFHKNKY